jgi:bacterioferritin (cytochrome b1)
MYSSLFDKKGKTAVIQSKENIHAAESMEKRIPHLTSQPDIGHIEKSYGHHMTSVLHISLVHLRHVLMFNI